MEAIIDDSIAINYRGNDRNDLIHIITNIDVKSEHKGELAKYVSPNAQKIFTSEFNALFLKGNFDIDNCQGVELNFTFDFKVGKKHYDCTFLDSKFSLGSIAVLIQGKFGTALYTGYFCYYPDFSISPFIFPFTQKKRPLNYLYLDATYHEQPSDFAGLHENIQKIVNLIETYKTKKVFIYAEKLTMDPIICELASSLSELVYVDKSRMETLKFLGYGKYFTSDINKSRISIAKGYLERKGKRCDQDILIVFIRHEKYTNKFLQCSYAMRNIYIFHFYCHSNHAECHRLIRELKPDHLIPIQPPLIEPSKIKLTPVDFMKKCKSFDISIELTPRAGTSSSEAKQAKTSSNPRQKRKRGINVSSEVVPSRKKCPLEAVQDLIIETDFSLQDKSPLFNTLKVRNPSEINESYELNNYTANLTISNCNDQCFVPDDFSNISPEYLLPSTSRGVPSVTSNTSRFNTSTFDRTPIESKIIESLPQFKKLREVLPKLEEVNLALPAKLNNSEHVKPDYKNIRKLKTHEPISTSSKAHSAKQMIKEDKNSSYISVIKSKCGAFSNNLPLTCKNIRSDKMENKKMTMSSTITSKESVISAKIIQNVNISENTDKIESMPLTGVTKSFVSSDQPPSEKDCSCIISSTDKSQNKKNDDIISKNINAELYPIKSVGQNINKTNSVWADRPLNQFSKGDHYPQKLSKVSDDNNRTNLDEDQVAPKTSKIIKNNKNYLKETKQPSDSPNVTKTSDGKKTLGIQKRSSEMEEKVNCNERLTIEQGNHTSCIKNDNKNDISNCSILSIPEVNASSIDRVGERIMNQRVDSDSIDVSNLVYKIYDEEENDYDYKNQSEKLSIHLGEACSRKLTRVDQNLILCKPSKKICDITGKSIVKHGSILQNTNNSDIHESKVKLNNLSLTEKKNTSVNNRDLVPKSSVQKNASNLTYEKLLQKYRIHDCYVHLNREDINHFHFYSKSRNCYVLKDYGYTRLECRRRQDFMMTKKFLGLVKKLRQKVAESQF